MIEFRPGIYRHYKGSLYQALFLAHDANADTLADLANGGWPNEIPVGDRVVVVYIALELDQAHTGIRPAVRTLEDWNAWVDRHGRAVNTDGYAGEPARRAQGWRPRFLYLGQQFEREMLGG